MPDLIRHPEMTENTGFRPFGKLTVLSLSKDSEAGMTRVRRHRISGWALAMRRVSCKVINLSCDSREIFKKISGNVFV